MEYIDTNTYYILRGSKVLEDVIQVVHVNYDTKIIVYKRAKPITLNNKIVNTKYMSMRNFNELYTKYNKEY